MSLLLVVNMYRRKLWLDKTDPCLEELRINAPCLRFACQLRKAPMALGLLLDAEVCSLPGDYVGEVRR